MWDAVRRELTRFHWDAAPPLTLDLMSDWMRTVHSLTALRRALGPVPPDDPIALLATATVGAARVADVSPVLAPSLQGVGAALAEAARVMAAGSDVVDRQGEQATLNQVAYELAHWVRVHTPDERANAWLQAGETALDSAIHAPAVRSTIGVGLAAWQEALAAVQPLHGTAIVRRSVALGHLMLLREAQAMVSEARDRGMLPESYADAALDNLRGLAGTHHATLHQIDGRQLGASRVDQAVMLKVGVAVRQMTSRDRAETPDARLADLLRSGFGQAVLVGHLLQQPSARTATEALSRLALEYVANPTLLRPLEPSEGGDGGRPTPRAPAPVWEAAPTPPSTQPSIQPGTVLDGAAVQEHCRARDLGVAAASADPANPPELVREIDPSRWPQLVVEGRQAVTDLVASVIPMAYAQTRGLNNAADLRGQMFVELMGAAYRFDPSIIGPERWPMYAWMTVKHTLWRGVDDSGVVRKRIRGPRPTAVSMDLWDPPSTNPGPSDIIEQRDSITLLARAVEQLPAALRAPLQQSMWGTSTRAIAEVAGYSESTARRRLHEARDLVKAELADGESDSRGHEIVNDPVLDRAQRLFEESFAPVSPPNRATIWGW